MMDVMYSEEIMRDMKLFHIHIMNLSFSFVKAVAKVRMTQWGWFTALY